MAIDPFKVDGPTCISLSGGRTSGYMLHRILQSNGGLPDGSMVLFCNTGKEEEATLRFVRDMAEHWQVSVTWLEYRIGGQFQVVTFDAASMEAMSKAAVRFALADAKTDITALAARVAELESELERASQPGSGDKHVDDIIERFKNPMTPYGMIVRAFRIATGSTLMQMADYLGVSPAQLSGMEHGRKPVTSDDAANAAGFFASLGMAPTLHVLRFALANPDAARASLDGRRDG